MFSITWKDQIYKERQMLITASKNTAHSLCGLLVKDSASSDIHVYDLASNTLVDSDFPELDKI